MNWFRLACFAVLCLLLCAATGGCLPAGDNPGDEQKEPYFLKGQKLTRLMDFPGAMDAYEKDLQINSRNASAHFELALLNEDQVHDPAAAIYHFERFLKLCPRGDNKIDAAQQHIASCKNDLAKSVASLTPLTPSAQSNVDHILLENRDLKAQLTALQDFYRTNHPPPVANVAPQTLPSVPNTARPPAGMTNTMTPGQTVPPPGATPPNHSASTRTCTIKAGDTLAGIARTHGISLEALQAANPGVDARHLRVGATLNLPPP